MRRSAKLVLRLELAALANARNLTSGLSANFANNYELKNYTRKYNRTLTRVFKFKQIAINDVKRKKNRSDQFSYARLC